ncbi:MAG: hypothetical protein IBJ11_10630 [Phycisphaerales bacterium]|nr:hypothetical protein [Phycisphaerales bacterium]
MKYFQYAVLALAPIVLIAGIVYWMRQDKSPVPSSRLYYNVLTGEYLWVGKNEALTIPWRDASGQFVLYPVEENPEGQYVLAPRYIPYLNSELAEGKLKSENLKVDTKTWRATTQKKQ